MIRDIMFMIDKSKPLEDESKISKMRATAYKNNKLIITKQTATKRRLLCIRYTL